MFSFDKIQAPCATKSCESSGKIIFSGVSFKVSINLFLSSLKKNRGPPRKATLPVIFLPQARPVIV